MPLLVPACRTLPDRDSTPPKHSAKAPSDNVFHGKPPSLQVTLLRNHRPSSSVNRPPFKPQEPWTAGPPRTPLAREFVPRPVPIPGPSRATARRAATADQDQRAAVPRPEPPPVVVWVAKGGVGPLAGGDRLVGLARPPARLGQGILVPNPLEISQLGSRPTNSRLATLTPRQQPLRSAGSDRGCDQRVAWRNSTASPAIWADS